MEIQTNKLIELKKRAELLRYNDTKELDDLKRKSKMIVESFFPTKLTYTLEVDQIQFYPSYVFDGISSKVYTDAWENGKQQLINFLDTRIEELKLKIENINSTSKERTVVKNVFTIDTKRIEELESEVLRLNAKQRLWKRIDLTSFFTISATVIGGVFALGYYLGNNHFDKEKLELYNENQRFKVIQDSISSLNSRSLPERSKTKK